MTIRLAESNGLFTAIGFDDHIALATQRWKDPNRRIETVYFMEAGIALVVAIQADDSQIEVGLIGREGMSGTAVMLGGDQSPL